MTAGGSRPKAKPPTYLERLLVDLDDIHTAYAKILAESTIVNVDPNRHATGDIVFVGSPKWGWAQSDSALEASRMALLRRVR